MNIDYRSIIFFKPILLLSLIIIESPIFDNLLINFKDYLELTIKFDTSGDAHAWIEYA